MKRKRRLRSIPTIPARCLLLPEMILRGAIQKPRLEILNSNTMAKRTDVGIELFKLQIFEQTQDLPQAEALLKRLVDLYPNENNFKKELIRLYLFQHRNDDAEKFQRAIAAAAPRYCCAVRPGTAVECYSGSRRRAPGTRCPDQGWGDTFPYQIALAQLDFVQGNSADGVALLKSLISEAGSAEHVTTAQTVLAQYYLSQKQPDAAAALVSDILAKTRATSPA